MIEFTGYFRWNLILDPWLKHDHSHSCQGQACACNIPPSQIDPFNPVKPKQSHGDIHAASSRRVQRQQPGKQNKKPNGWEPQRKPLATPS